VQVSPEIVLNVKGSDILRITIANAEKIQLPMQLISVLVLMGIHNKFLMLTAKELDATVQPDSIQI